MTSSLPEIPHDILACMKKEIEKKESFWDNGRYPYIPLPLDTAKEMIDIACTEFQKRRGRDPETFLEVGCGFGLITHYVQTHLGLDATGIDIVQRYVLMSQDRLQGTYLWRDALRFRSYGKYDIVYFYQPFLDHEMGKRFCARVAKQATGIVAPYYGLRGTVFEYPDPNYYDSVKPKWYPMRLSNGYCFAAFDGATKQMIPGTRKEWRS